MQYGSPHKNIVGYKIHAASRFTFSFTTLFNMVQHKVKVKSFLCTPQKYVDVEVWLHSLLTLTWDGRVWSASRTSLLYLRWKSPQSLGRPPTQTGYFQNKLITLPDFKLLYHPTHNPVTTLTQPSHILWQDKTEKQILISCY